MSLPPRQPRRPRSEVTPILRLIPALAILAVSALPGPLGAAALFAAEEAPASPPAVPSPAQPPAPTAAELQRRLELLERKVRELQETGPAPQGPPAPAPTPATEVPVEVDKRLDLLEEWKAKVERLPSLSGKVNVGLNALQFLYSHQDAQVAAGQSQDNFSIRRSEVLLYGRINEYLPKWHVLFEFQSINLTPRTPGCPSSGSCASAATGPPASATFFRESYIDYRPSVNLAPSLNFIRMGIFRMPFGIFTETSGGLRDIISSPYLNAVGSGSPNALGTGGPIDFIQERDFFVDARGLLGNRLEYVVGIMNNNNFQANAVGANGPKVVYTRQRFLLTDVSFVSFTVMGGGSNNTNTAINGRGQGNFDRYGADFRYVSKVIPGLYLQGEYWQGHDASNQTVVGLPAQGDCLNKALCGGSGAPGVQRRTWYVYGKYLFTEGLVQNWEPVVYYEQFDPNTKVSDDLYTRLILGLTYYFENLPPKIQSKVQFNYEFRHHQGLGPGIPYSSNFDAFAQNAWLIQWQIRYQ